MKKKAEEVYSYVALLRGINVGGNKTASMAEVKKTFERMGFTHVGSILATGNIIFDTEIKSQEEISKMITTTLKKTFGFNIPVILRSLADIRKMIAKNPFKNIDVTTQTRLYVSFLSGPPKSKLAIPYTSPDESFRILSISDGSIFSVLDLTKAHTPDAMNILEKEYGKDLTTRNWNTVVKISKA